MRARRGGDIFIVGLYRIGWKWSIDAWELDCFDCCWNLVIVGCLMMKNVQLVQDMKAILILELIIMIIGTDRLFRDGVMT